MNNLLEQHQKNDINIKFQQGDLILYEPDEYQLNEISDMLNNNIGLDENFNINKVIPFKDIRFVIRELTNIGHDIDNYTDEELEIKLKNGDKQIKALLSAIEDLLNEIAEDIFNNYVAQVKFINSYLNIINNTKNIDNMKKKVNTLFKKNKINMTIDDLAILQNGSETDKLKLIEKINIKK